MVVAVLLLAVCRAVVPMTATYRWTATMLVNNSTSLDRVVVHTGPITTNTNSTAADPLAPSTSSRMPPRTVAVARQADHGAVELAAVITSTEEAHQQLVLPLLTTVATVAAIRSMRGVAEVPPVVEAAEWTSRLSVLLGEEEPGAIISSTSRATTTRPRLLPATAL